MKFSANLIRFTTLLVVAGLMSVLVPNQKANAAIGVVVALTSKNEAMKSIGWDLAGLGGLTAIVGTFANTNNTKCTPSAPCSCVTSDYNDQSCQVNGPGTTITQCYNNYNIINCDNTTTWPGDRYSGTNGSAEANGTIITIGLVLLGTEATPSIQFRMIDDASAKQLGLNAKQQDAFNIELNKINLMANDFLTQIKQDVSQGMKPADLKNASHTLWEQQAKPVLSTDAYTALQTASAAYLKLMGGQIALSN